MAGSETSAAGSNANDWLPGPPHTLEAEACVKAFKTDVKMGLDPNQVAEYQATFGPNKLKESPPVSFWSILIRNALNGELYHDSYIFPYALPSLRPHEWLHAARCFNCDMITASLGPNRNQP